MAHEDLTREHVVESSSERSFGIVFAVVFVIIGTWPLLHAQPPRWWSVVIAALFAVVAWLAPSLLSAPNRLWLKLGLLLGKIVGPIALSIVFYGVLMPIGGLMRIAGKDPLRLRLDRDARTYWISRTPPGPPPDSMTNQF